MSKKFVAYYRVSTPKQGESGLGLDAQRHAVADFLKGEHPIAEFTEVESGKRNNRPQLAEAFEHCRLCGARLVIAKLDRLSRDAHFLLGLKKAGIDFVATDMPHANRLTVGVMAMVAEQEADAISERTKNALAQVKLILAKGGTCKPSRAFPQGRTWLGTPENLINADKGREASRRVRKARADQRAASFAPILDQWRAEGIISLDAVARQLTAKHYTTPRGKATWSPMQVARLVKRIEELPA
jgi:DNA invertase Pin-like site-specific DNA recombinase